MIRECKEEKKKSFIFKLIKLKLCAISLQFIISRRITLISFIFFSFSYNSSFINE